MEGQINHFKQQLKQAEFEVKYLRGVVDKVLDIQLNFSNSKLDLAKGQGYKALYSSSYKERIRQLIIENNFQSAFEEIKSILSVRNPSRMNEITILQSRYMELKLNSLTNTIQSNVKEVEINKIRKGLLEIIDNS